MKSIPDKALKAKTLAAAEQIMIDAGLLTFGIEHVACGEADLAYINLGDTYDQTICREGNGPLFLGSWGKWFERTENAQNEDEGTITCGYCSHRTPMDKDDWRDVTCESCGHKVGG